MGVEDFKKFLRLLNARRIEYLLIGGAAYNFHAPPRATKDLDLWVRPTRENLTRLVDAIREFGFPTADLRVDELVRKRQVLMLGRVPYRLDLLTSPAGLQWASSWRRRVAGKYDGVPIAILSLRDLIAAKRAAGRPRDLVDVDVLARIALQRPRRPGRRPAP